MAARTGAKAAPDAAAQFRARGYLLTEANEMILKDLFAAMEATAFAYDRPDGAEPNFDLTGDQVAAVLRTWVVLGQHILSGAPFVSDASARRREDVT